MIQFKESRINSFHNYMVDGMLMPSFSAGNPWDGPCFYFIAEKASEHEDFPLISASIYDAKGAFAAELKRSRIDRNPGACRFERKRDGFILHSAEGEKILEAVRTTFANCCMTVVKGRLYDEKGDLRMEQHGRNASLKGTWHRGLRDEVEAPFTRIRDNG